MKFFGLLVAIINGQIGVLLFDNLIGIWQFNNDTKQFENKIDFYRKVYEEIHKIGKTR